MSMLRSIVVFWIATTRQGFSLHRVPKSRAMGGVILAHRLSRKELDAVLAEDPFKRELLAACDVIEFRPSKFAPGLESLFQA